MSDVFALYGPPSGIFDVSWQDRLWRWLSGGRGSRAYLVWFRLVLNLERVKLHAAVAHLRGQSAVGNQQLGPEWADAIASDWSEVDELLVEANTQRDFARQRMKGSGPPS